MPTVLRIGSYRFFFYPSDKEEPPHIHVQKGDGLAKYWLNPVMYEKSTGLKSHELMHIQKILENERDYILEKWNEFFND